MVLVRNPLCHTQLQWNCSSMRWIGPILINVNPQKLIYQENSLPVPWSSRCSARFDVIYWRRNAHIMWHWLHVSHCCYFILFFFVLILYAMIYLQLFFSMYNNLLTVKFLIFRFLIKKYMMMGMDSDVHAFSVGSWTMLIFLWLFEFWTVSGYGKFLFWKCWILVSQMKITQRYVGSLINRITQIYFVFFFILP